MPALANSVAEKVVINDGPTVNDLVRIGLLDDRMIIFHGTYNERSFAIGARILSISPAEQKLQMLKVSCQVITVMGDRRCALKRAVGDNLVIYYSINKHCGYIE